MQRTNQLPLVPNYSSFIHCFLSLLNHLTARLPQPPTPPHPTPTFQKCSEYKTSCKAFAVQCLSIRCMDAALQLLDLSENVFAFVSNWVVW